MYEYFIIDYCQLKQQLGIFFSFQLESVYFGNQRIRKNLHTRLEGKLFNFPHLVLLI